MEVHHHPQVEKKNFKEYFLEFVMIFLAVTMGFIAENIREHFSDTSKAKEYAQSLYDDFKIDTASIQRTIDEKKWIMSKYDSAKNIIAFNKVTENNEFIYYIERYLADNDVFTSQDVTYQQLRGSGNFRYFKSIALYKKIANYFNLYSRYQQVDGSFSNGGNGLSSEMESKIFDPEDLSGLTNDAASNFYNLELRPTNKLKPITTDEQCMKLLYTKFADARRRSLYSLIMLNILKRSSTEIIKEMKDEYRLE
ncbi:MAG: hypothetical protein KGM16_14525 [Bacteroidota bacterium]|nr:hypothetical protein [Bacteroidota bacterium]